MNKIYFWKVWKRTDDYSASRGRDSTIDNNRLTSDVACLLRGQKGSRHGHIPRITHVAHGDGSVTLGLETGQVTASILVCKEPNQWRVHQTGHDYIQADTLCGIQYSRRLGKLDDSSLGGRVGHLGLANVAQAGNRRNIDDDTAALFFEEGQDMVTAQVPRLKVDVDLGILDVLGHFGGPPGLERPTLLTRISILPYFSIQASTAALTDSF